MAQDCTQVPLRASITEGAVDGVVVAASDTVDDPNGPFFSLYVGVAAGNIQITTLLGNTLLLTAVPLGVLRIGCRRVWSTNTTTTAALIIGLK